MVLHCAFFVAVFLSRLSFLSLEVGFITCHTNKFPLFYPCLSLIPCPPLILCLLSVGFFDTEKFLRGTYL